MGTMLHAPLDHFSAPQIVHYTQGQKYNLHTDYWPVNQTRSDGGTGDFVYNRLASFFVFLEDSCTGGETYFPLVEVDDISAGLAGKVSRGGRSDVEEERDKGVKFKPIKGNAIFWVNLDEEGRGDERVVHAGLPLGDGEKVGLNIWPRRMWRVEPEEEIKTEKRKVRFV